LLDQKLDEVRIATVLGDAPHVFKKLAFGVRAEISAADVVIGKIRDQDAKVLHAAVDHPHRTRGESRIPATLALRGDFQDEDPRAVFARGQRRAKPGVASADDDDVE